MDDTQRLVVSLEARLTKYERDMARARNATNDNFKKMEGRARQSAENMERTMGKASASIGEKLQGMFAPLMKGGAVVAGVGGAAIALKEIANSVAEVDREARKAGVSSKVWQQWTYVATATGMSIDGVTDALKELNIRGDEFAKTGKGSAEEAFQRLGYSATDVAQKLKDPSRFLDEIIVKLQQMDAAAQTRILDEVFGGTGAEQIAKVLGMSVTEIQKMRSEAATFTDEQVEAAKRIDREFSTMWRNFTVYAKQAAVEGVNVASKVIGFINDPTIGARDRRLAEYNSPEKQLERLQKQRDGILKAIEREKANTGNFLQQAELRNLETALSAVDDQILDLTGCSDQFKQALKELSAASNSLSGAFGGNVTAASNFKNALIELKNLVPELKAELDTLATTDGIDAAYNKAVQSARTMGEVMNATNLANRAKSIATFGNHSNMLDLIGAAEGTDKGRGYNETLGYGAFTGGAVNLTGMTLNEVLALQQRMLAHPGNSHNSSAVGRYQIVSKTLRSLMDEMSLSGDRLFDEDTQDELARALLRRRGNDPAALRNEWEGLRRVDDGTISNAYGGTPTAAQQLAPTDSERERTELLKQQDAARRSLNQSVEEGLALARFEQSISGMSAAQQRLELAVYQAEQEAKRAGITLTDQELAKLREKIALTQQLDGTNQQVAASADGLKNAQQYFAESFTSSLSGLLTGTQTLNGALQNLLSSLIDATLQAALLGKGPLAGLGGIGTGIFGALLGFSEGGYTGDGGKYQPAGVVHRGEYVMSKKATSRIGVANLEAMHKGALRGYAEGGLVTGAPALRSPNLKAANSNEPAAQQITISAPITVNGSAGTPEQNSDLAAKMAKQLEVTMRSVVNQEILRASRPGNLLNTRSR
ncbi:muramidase (phage lysozyme)/molecular chaperone GrpE (heat shock protein) [Peteryoungia aggregata LMG 23059]|uniref:Muramidase (Phage lysozyme)/molecular chaperone GrpE (Heat shock protein) n=1 Tax=Peteryoungia aggregata LMG 23059 TaxID=1368425 RepID=A0ABU0G8P4_9HYPH|nr:phage tail tape measure protein [Peteryoungia aggregata]MDQ0421116.1 muramidase (phage lysozyme)/molecular chaperone GrpE (heat shock protein) [Peteryoungia aggregata LMG 23059]